ncbi:expressed unknown protein [Seminavis robusta]|uniref:Uncharacterized protein n=1 Tax=Seminavis robusta TaxID=568900 RepID=A0A9N8DE52_9STRA|nr:expressed unknown protein [Seminavis robusta]|eukprot:Sro106_g053490.1 n/a (143) ;mRNA; r:30558-30986
MCSALNNFMRANFQGMSAKMTSEAKTLLPHNTIDLVQDNASIHSTAKCPWPQSPPMRGDHVSSKLVHRMKHSQRKQRRVPTKWSYPAIGKDFTEPCLAGSCTCPKMPKRRLSMDNMKEEMPPESDGSICTTDKDSKMVANAA